MSPGEEEFLQTLRATFRVEAAEHLQTIATGLLELEKNPAPEQRRRMVESAFRAAHSLKGAARAVNFADVEAACQSLEDLFASWKKGDAAPSPQALDTAHRYLDAVSSAIGNPAASEPARTSVAPSVTQPVAVRTDEATRAQTVRIAVDKLDACLLEAEEMVTAKLAAGQRAVELRALADQVDKWRSAWAKVRPQLRAVEAGGLNEFFEWNNDHLRALQDHCASLYRAAEHDRLVLGKLVDDLLADSKKLLMLPLATLGAPLPKLVRDLCRDQGKQADLVMRGEDVEIDKRVLEEMKDPLIHLLRNSVDHGVETVEQRAAAGKVPRATITLEVSAIDSNQVQILVADDGAGIDPEKVKAAAVERGLLTPEAAAQLPERDALALVFETEVSTSPIITELSGRGLGLAIVREKVEKLAGRITVESRRNVGTTFRLSLPATLATFRGVLVRAAEQLFVLPTAEIERVIRFRPDEVQTVEARETLALHERPVALVRLTDVLGLAAASASQAASTATPAVVLGSGDHRVAFAIDEVLDEHEVLIKRLSKPLVRVRHIAGATILGSGQIVPVLRVADLLRSAKQAGTPALSAASPTPVRAGAKSVLLAEDSITSRLLLKGILESAGYRVRTAVDGLEAFTALRTESFDLLVSDVEMPRLNGFDLAARVRADRKLGELPVVLVTALESREDRERGIAVGADAYLVKSSFDQSNLLEVVRRLI